MDDFAIFSETEHMLRWLAEEPYNYIRESLEEMITNQVADAQLVDIRALEEPQWLSGARKKEEDGGKAILTRCGVAFALEMDIRQPDDSMVRVSGVYSWVSKNLDTAKPKSRIWVDVDGTLDEFGSEGQLMVRMYFDDE